MSATVLLAVADGSEDIETITLLDVLRRGGLQVTLTSVMPQRQVTCAHGTQLRADALLADVLNQDFDAIVLPGGMPGAEHFASSGTLVSMLEEQNARGEVVAAICAAPAVVLAKHGLLEGRRAVAYPGFEEAIVQGGAELLRQNVVHDGNIITSRGPATAMEFALFLVEVLVGEKKAKEVQDGLLVP
ncbi:MAG: DJ-1 family glyoxalase III [Venatoribacter sp.]